MIRETLAMQSAHGVAAIVWYWFEVQLGDAEADILSGKFFEWNVILPSERYRADAILGNRFSISCAILIWLKSRIMDLGLLRGTATDDGTDRMLNEHGLSACPASAGEHRDSDIGHLTFSRSKISRSMLSSIEPIDRVAMRVTGVRPSTACAECGKYFRNPAAHRIHVAEQHPHLTGENHES